MIHVVIGTRAQYIKIAPVLLRLKEEGLPYRLVHTGQHRATIEEILGNFALPLPDHRLCNGPDVVSPSAMLRWAAQALSRGVKERRRLFGDDGRGIVVVHGDTVSTLLGALLGRMAGLKVAHVESGLRSFDLWHPFPEELTRVAAFRLCHILFCPGPKAAANVAGLNRTVVDTGANTMADAVHRAAAMNLRSDHIPAEPFVLASLHRYENIFRQRRLQSIVDHLERMARARRLLFILHPPTEARLRMKGLFAPLAANRNIELRPRYSYLDFFALMKKADFVVTDGGSIQEESSYLGLPCLLMRGRSERPEGLGQNVVLSEYDPAKIAGFTENPGQYRRQPAAADADPSGIIAAHLRKFA